MRLSLVDEKARCPTLLRILTNKLVQKLKRRLYLTEFSNGSDKDSQFSMIT
jgi:hypothetical protein